jgi:prefoldin subunit 5
LTSRLNTKRKLEERYIEILKKATKVSEILEIEKQISAIREEIEAKQGQLKYLESRVSESTVTIEFYKTIAQKEGVKISYGSKIWNSIKVRIL